MNRPIAVLRPEPGNAATAEKLAAMGCEAVRLPLFAVRPLDWTVPPGEYDALILTSANAVRHAGAGLAALMALPVYAVGAATADAAREAGLNVVFVGNADGPALERAAAERGVDAGLHLTGREHRQAAGGAIRSVVAAYASEPLHVTRASASVLTGAVALVHSPRAGARLAELVDTHGIARAGIVIAAISERTAAAAAGGGWRHIAVAAQPDDDTLIALARRLTD